MIENTGNTMGYACNFSLGQPSWLLHGISPFMKNQELSNTESAREWQIDICLFQLFSTTCIIGFYLFG